MLKENPFSIPSEKLHCTLVLINPAVLKWCDASVPPYQKSLCYFIRQFRNQLTSFQTHKQLFHNKLQAKLRLT